MLRTGCIVATIAVVTACGDDAAPEAAAPEPALPDAAPATPPAPASDPDGGTVDVAEDDPDPHEPSPWRRLSRRKPRRRHIEITLRSTPPNAVVAVDGMKIGRTPTFWEGTATGRPREFSFVLDGHETARYRFVPTRSGIVHAPLERVPGRPEDAGPPRPPLPSEP